MNACLLECMRQSYRSGPCRDSRMLLPTYHAPYCKPHKYGELYWMTFVCQRNCLAVGKRRSAASFVKGIPIARLPATGRLSLDDELAHSVEQVIG